MEFMSADRFERVKDVRIEKIQEVDSFLFSDPPVLPAALPCPCFERSDQTGMDGVF